MTKRFDIFPAIVSPLPDGVPPSGMKLRAVGFDEGLVVLWGNGHLNSVDRVEVHAEPALDVNRYGGTIGGFHVTKGPGCQCGSRQLRSMQVTRLITPAPVPVAPEPEEIEIAAVALTEAAVTETEAAPPQRASRRKPSPTPES